MALPGAVLPGDRRIERTEKMGVTSNGMLCSGDELGLTSDADGILILPGDTPIGVALTELYGDTVLDVDVKPNRGDALSIVGLAREVAAMTGATLRYPAWDVDEQGPPVGDRLSVEVREPELCPRFVGRWVSGVTVGPSPDWVQMRLQAAGMRPISNVVDASNYVMVELGKPIHTFDAAAVRDGRIVVRRAEAGERFETLDHVARTLDPDTLVIADADGPVGIAGIMGGTESEVTDATTDIIVESAIFDPINIRRLGVPLRAALRCEPALREGPGVAAGADRRGPDDAAAHRVGRRYGLDGRRGLGPDGTGRRSRRLPAGPHEPAARHGPRHRSTSARCWSASASRRTSVDGAGLDDPGRRRGQAARGRRRGRGHRGDRARPGGATSRSKPTSSRRWPASTATSASRRSCRTRRCRTSGLTRSRSGTRSARRLAGAGVTEAVTFALVAPAMVERFPWRDDGAPTGEPDQAPGGAPVVVSNPLSGLHSVMRQSLLGSLLEVVATNLRHGRDDVAIFEIGKGYGAGRRTGRRHARVVAPRASRSRATPRPGLEPRRAAVRPG